MTCQGSIGKWNLFIQLTWDEISEMIKQAKEGDILLIAHNEFLYDILKFVDTWDHAGIITGPNEVTEAFNDQRYDHDGDNWADGGIGTITLREFYERDAKKYNWVVMSLMRVKKASFKQRKEAAKYAREIDADESIDYSFLIIAKARSIELKQYYCSLLVWHAYYKAGVDLESDPKKKSSGGFAEQLSVLPSELYLNKWVKEIQRITFGTPPSRFPQDVGETGGNAQFVHINGENLNKERYAVSSINITIFDLNGKLIFAGAVTNSRMAFPTMTNLPNGVYHYVLHITNLDGSIFISKLMKFVLLK
jgi:hypothetical protein